MADVHRLSEEEEILIDKDVYGCRDVGLGEHGWVLEMLEDCEWGGCEREWVEGWGRRRSRGEGVGDNLRRKWCGSR